jgi:hypothetical protein
MKNVEVDGDRTIRENPTYTMRRLISFRFAEIESAVASFFLASLPLPTVVRRTNLDFAPKAFEGRIRIHQNLPFWCHALGLHCREGFD